MTEETIEMRLDADLSEVWDKVTSLTDYSWRSDIERIEVVSGEVFVEYARGGYATEFRITEKRPYSYYAFDIKNGNMHGSWVGTFEEENGGVKAIFTEKIAVDKLLMRPFARAYLRKMQRTYAEDLKKALARGE